jgi:hypothetical protein
MLPEPFPGVLPELFPGVLPGVLPETLPGVLPGMEFPGLEFPGLESPPAAGDVSVVGRPGMLETGLGEESKVTGGLVAVGVGVGCDGSPPAFSFSSHATAPVRLTRAM